MAFAIEKEERFAAFNAQMCIIGARRVREDRQAILEEAQLDREGCTRETSAGLTHRPFPLLSVGVVAGIRHCQQPDAPDRLGRQLHFADSRSKAMRMVNQWISAGVRLGVNLGNIVDQRCAMHRKHEIALQSIKSVLCDDFKTGTWRFQMQDHHQMNKFRADVLHLFGDHDLQHFSMQDLDSKLDLWNTVSNANQSAMPPPEQDCRYFSTQIPGGWRMIFIDTNDISCRSGVLAKRDLARAWLNRARQPGRPACLSNSGAVGQAQLKWLQDELTRSKAAGERAVLFSHSTLSESVARQGGEPELICWNYREVVNVITSPETHSVVVCCISGQQVNGGFGIDDLTKKGRGRLHHLGIRNAVAEPAGGDCFGILEFFSERLVLRGHGGVKPVTISCQTAEQTKSSLDLEKQRQENEVKRAAQGKEDVLKAKQAEETRVTEEMAAEEAEALKVDAEERRLYKIAQEQEDRERKQRLASLADEQRQLELTSPSSEDSRLKSFSTHSGEPMRGSGMSSPVQHAATLEEGKYVNKETRP